MRYLLLIYGDEAARAQMEEQIQTDEMKAWYDYTDWLREKGWYVAGEALELSSTATTVRAQDDQTLSTDGPFAETKEQLGGYYVIDCANLDDAIEAASKIPSVAYGAPVEVRPIRELPGMSS